MQVEQKVIRTLLAARESIRERFEQENHSELKDSGLAIQKIQQTAKEGEKKPSAVLQLSVVPIQFESPTETESLLPQALLPLYPIYGIFL